MAQETQLCHTVDIVVNGQVLSAQENQTVAVALSQHGIVVLRESPSGAKRGVFCGMGACFECRVTIDGIPDQRACITPVRPGMRITLGLGG